MSIEVDLSDRIYKQLYELERPDASYRHWLQWKLHQSSPFEYEAPEVDHRTGRFIVPGTLINETIKEQEDL